MTSTRRDQVSHPSAPPSNLLGIYRRHPNSFRKDTQIVHPRLWHIQNLELNWSRQETKATLYSLWFKFLCPGLLIVQNAACREVQTVLRADVSLGQCPAHHPFVSDSIPSQAQHWRMRNSWASAFQEQGLVATVLWARASADTNSSWKCCRPSPQPPPDTKAFSNSTQKRVHSVLGCRGSQPFWTYQHSKGLKHAMTLGGL